MRYAMIDRNGLVVHVIEATENDPPKFENYTMHPSETANVGDKYDGKKFAPPPGGPYPLRFRAR